LPKTKIVLSDNWTWNDFTLIPKLIRFGGFTSVQNLASQTRSFNAKWITDLELSWRFAPQWSVAVGANNLFNIYPSPAGIFKPYSNGRAFALGRPSDPQRHAMIEAGF